MPNDILNGSTKKFQFIGLLSFKDMLENLQNEFNQMPKISADLSSIQQKGLEGFATTAQSSIKNFSTQFKSQETANGIGGKGKPLYVENLTVDINDAVKIEFNQYITIAKQLNEAATKGALMGTSGAVSSQTDVLSTVL